MHMPTPNLKLPPNTPEAAVQKRVCNDCGRLLELRCFRRVRAGNDTLRHSHCDECRRERERVRRLKRRFKRVAGLMERLADAEHLRSITGTLRVLLREMKGLHGFGKMIRELMVETKPTSPIRQKIALAYMNLTVKREELEQQLAIAQREYNDQVRGEMTDEELDASIVETVVPILRRRPHLAARLVQVVGTQSGA